MFKNILHIFLLVSLLSCRSTSGEAKEENKQPLTIKAADFSFLPEVRASGISYYNSFGKAEDMLVTFKNAGGNTVRLRLWVDPTSPTSGLQQVKNLAQEIKAKGMKVWLSLHYSDTWADPSQQTKPNVWKQQSYSELKKTVYDYTKLVMQEISADFIQIGNEVNNGFLWQDGYITNLYQFKELLKTGIEAVRANNTSTKIMIHFAGYQDASAFYQKISDLDYDYIALSYYPIWHGKNFEDLNTHLQYLNDTFNKPILIAETSYPFTLGWNDHTNNVVGLDSQLISAYPATPEGQKNFMLKLKSTLENLPNAKGFCYWGGEWTSYKGASSTDGSTWENQAFWDFNNKQLPVLDVYKD